MTQIEYYGDDGEGKWRVFEGNRWRALQCQFFRVCPTDLANKLALHYSTVHLPSTLQTQS